MKVRYNGGTDSIMNCNSPVGILVPGKVYEEIGATDMAWQKNIALKEVDGWYNAKWFDVVKD